MIAEQKYLSYSVFFFGLNNAKRIGGLPRVIYMLPFSAVAWNTCSEYVTAKNSQAYMNIHFSLITHLHKNT